MKRGVNCLTLQYTDSKYISTGNIGMVDLNIWKTSYRSNLKHQIARISSSDIVSVSPGLEDHLEMVWSWGGGGVNPPWNILRVSLVSKALRPILYCPISFILYIFRLPVAPLESDGSMWGLGTGCRHIDALCARFGISPIRVPDTEGNLILTRLALIRPRLASRGFVVFVL